MKKNIFIIVLFFLVLSACGETKNNQEKESPALKTETQTQISEAELIDSISTVLEQAINEIKESEEKLDDLLKDL